MICSYFSKHAKRHPNFNTNALRQRKMGLSTSSQEVTKAGKKAMMSLSKADSVNSSEDTPSEEPLYSDRMSDSLPSPWKRLKNRRKSRNLESVFYLLSTILCYSSNWTFLLHLSYPLSFDINFCLTRIIHTDSVDFYYFLFRFYPKISVVTAGFFAFYVCKKWIKI